MPSTNPRLMHFTVSAACAAAGNAPTPAASGAPAIRRIAARLVIFCVDIDLPPLIAYSIRQLLALRVPRRGALREPLERFVQRDADQHDSEQRAQQGNSGNFNPGVIDDAAE